MKGKWSAFYLKAFPFVRTGVKSVEPSICVCVFIINWNVPSISLSICIVTHVLVCFISCIFVILSCLVCRLSMSTRSRFGRQFVLDFVFNINIRFKEHAKLNKSLLVVGIGYYSMYTEWSSSLSPSINYMLLYNSFDGDTPEPEPRLCCSFKSRFSK